jgi:hypothetical protein
MTLFNSSSSTFEPLLKKMVAEQQPKPPIDIEAIAKSFGLEIVYEPMLCNGYLEEIGHNKYLIKVNKKSIKFRQRFTIGHEFGHFIINLEGQYKIKCLLKENLPVEERFIHFSTDEEKICDFISASLLIPLYTVKRLSDWTKISIAIIEETSKKWAVSKDVILRRVLTLAPFEGGFIWGKTQSKRFDPLEIDLHSCWGIFPKYKKLKIPKEIHLKTSTYSLMDFTGKKETFDRVIFDLEGLRGLRTICAKAYGEGEEKRVLIIVYPREVKHELLQLGKSEKQSVLPLK